MRRFILCIVIMLCFTSFAWAQEQEEKKNPTGSISFILTDSFAPIGLGVEFFIGNFGIGPTFTTFIVGAAGSGVIFVIEPGAYVRYYFGDIESTFYVTSGVTYLTAVGTYEGNVEALEFGLLKINAGVGYNSIFGKNENARFSIEFGPRYRILTDPNQDAMFPISLHFMLMFGTVF